jgi:phosphoketolase
LQLAGRVDGFGGNSGTIVASSSGNIPGQSSGGETHHEHHKHHEEVSGKVSELLFDHFGDFEGFSLETRLGEFRCFHSRERRVLEIVRAALEDRSWLTVIRESKKHDQVLSIIVRVPPPWHV